MSIQIYRKTIPNLDLSESQNLVLVRKRVLTAAILCRFERNTAMRAFGITKRIERATKRIFPMTLFHRRPDFERLLYIS